MATATKTRRLVGGGNPDVVAHVPPEIDFEREGATFLEDANLSRTMHDLIEAHPRLRFLQRLGVDVFWKQKGGLKGGKPVFSKATKPSGLLRQYSEQDFILWLAADHMRELCASAYTVEAALFNALLYCGQDDEGKPKLLAPDFTGFFVEVEHYGPWHEDLQRVGIVFEQLEFGFVTDVQAGLTAERERAAEAARQAMAEAQAAVATAQEAAGRARAALNGDANGDAGS